jgi:hypothetical protein
VGLRGLELRARHAVLSNRFQNIANNCPLPRIRTPCRHGAVSDLTRVSDSRMQALNFLVSHTGESAGRAVLLMAKPSCRRRALVEGDDHAAPSRQSAVVAEPGSLMAPDRGSCYAGRMSFVATLAMLVLMPAAAASMPAVKSAQCPPGYIVSGGYCTPMFRPAPAAVPKVGQCRSSYAQTRNSCVEMRRN